MTNPKQTNIDDPIELIVANGLTSAGIEFIHENEGGTFNLDFFLPEQKIYIEVKQFHSERIAEQSSRVENIIVIQGRHAAKEFAKMIGVMK